jgi:hypothetical protein
MNIDRVANDAAKSGVRFAGIGGQTHKVEIYVPSTFGAKALEPDAHEFLVTRTMQQFFDLFGNAIRVFATGLNAENESNGAENISIVSAHVHTNDLPKLAEVFQIAAMLAYFLNKDAIMVAYSSQAGNRAWFVQA